MKKTLALVLAMVLLSGCTEGGDRAESELPPESTVSSQTQSSDNSKNSSTPPTESTNSSRTQSSDNSTVSSETSNDNQTGLPEELAKYIDSLGNGSLVFVDYTFTDDPAVITNKSELGDVYDSALEALKATDDYKKFSGSFTKDSPQARFSRPVEDFFTAGSAEAVFRSAYTDDFDRDGAEESFVLLTIAKDNGVGMWGERDYLVFVGNGGTEVLCDYYNADFRAALDYGACGQIIVDSEGWAGADALSNIWGVNSGKAVELYDGHLSYKKTECFLYSMGPQYIGDFMVFDIANGEYLAIRGKELSADEITAMDGGNTFDKVYTAVLVGGKFFIINTNGCYTYENGKFVSSDKYVRASATPGYTGEGLKTLNDVDYDAAIASMISVEEARQSAGN